MCRITRIGASPEDCSISFTITRTVGHNKTNRYGRYLISKFGEKKIVLEISGKKPAHFISGIIIVEAKKGKREREKRYASLDFCDIVLISNLD